MERKARRADNKHAASADLSPAEAVVLLLDGVDPAEIRRLGAEESRRLKRAGRSDFNAMDRVGGRALCAASGKCSESAVALWHPAAGDGFGRPRPESWARVCGHSMSSHGLRDGDLARLDHDMEPGAGDIVLAEVEGVGRILRKLSIIGGVYALTAGPGVEPVLVDDRTRIVFHGVVVGVALR